MDRLDRCIPITTLHLQLKLWYLFPGKFTSTENSNHNNHDDLKLHAAKGTGNGLRIGIGIRPSNEAHSTEGDRRRELCQPHTSAHTESQPNMARKAN